MSAEYAFRVTGRLTPALMGALEPLEATVTTTETTLVGRLPDRAALHGALASIEALGLELVGFQRLPRRPGCALHGCPACAPGSA